MRCVIANSLGARRKPFGRRPKRETVTILGIDDTDSRDRGMCTTYVAHTLCERLREREDEHGRENGGNERPLLVRLNPAVEHKTRGNAALALQTTLDPEAAVSVATTVVDRLAETDDPNTNPGVVAAPDAADWSKIDANDAVFAFARAAVTEQLTIADAERVLTLAGYHTATWGNGRGRIGALAAVGAWIGRQQSLGVFSDRVGCDSVPPDDRQTQCSAAERSVSGRGTENNRNRPYDWTYECISYRSRERWGTPRSVDPESVVRAAEGGYPTVWDTVDRGENELVCVPHTPCPILHGVRGDDPAECERVATAIEGEPVATRRTFVTNQGTDAHLREADCVDAMAGGCAYRVNGTVESPPETMRGGHVFTSLTDDSGTIDCVAFAPTKRFRSRVRALRPGDRITACGEVSSGTLKLEKFAVRSLTETERATPTCPVCDRRMESAGRDQGYRCRACETSAPEKVEQPIDRELEAGWYEVPPTARRHIAKPLVRGGFDAPTHPEK